MSKKVLIFEADPAFAGELRDGLTHLGCAVTVVDDVNAGLQLASTDRPDLILLAIELPRMNGFSVCNKLKRDPALKDVPLIIMSTDSNEETFEQHRRLRTRAEDYVHKPIGFDELLRHCNALVPLATTAEDVTEDDIVLDDIEIDEAEVIDNGSAVDHEVADFADQAFDALIDDGAPSPAAPAPGGPPPVPQRNDAPERDPAAAPEPLTVGEEDLRIESEPAAPPDEPAAPAAPEPLAALAAPAPVATEPRLETSTQPEADAASRARVESLEAALAAARRDADAMNAERTRAESLDAELRQLRETLAATEQQAERAERLEQELALAQQQAEATRQKLEQASSGRSVGSAREFLDLREALNKKDKEILDLRDQVTHRDKEILALRDGSLAFERAQADQIDRIAELERQLPELQRQTDAFRADKEQAAKRADDFKRKVDKLQSDLEARARQLEEANAAHAAELEQRAAEAAAVDATHAEALAKVAADGEAALERAVSDARAVAAEAEAAAVARVQAEAAEAQRRALVEREQELRVDLDARLGALHRAHDDALGKLRAEQEQFAREAAEREAALVAERDQLAAERDRARSDLAALDQAKASGEAERDARIAALGAERDERSGERDAARRTVEERDRVIAGLEADLRERTEERDAARRTVEERDRKLAELEAELSRRGSEHDAFVAAKGEEIAAIQRALEAEQRQVAQARAKWDADRSSLEGAKNALAAALARIEEAEGRGLE